MSLVAIARKELGDLVREKRFGAWALTFLAFWMVFLFFYLGSMERSSGGFYGPQNPQSIVSLVEPAFYFYGIGFAVLALFVLTDGITKEREAGMLALVAAKPIVRWHIVLAKLLAGIVVYLASFVVTIGPATILALAMGFPAFQMLALLYAGPFLILYLFLLGLGLLLGVVSSSSKVAIGTASGIFLPLFFLMTDGPLQLLYQRYPGLRGVAAYTPFEASHQAARVAIQGGQMPWGPIAFTVAAALLFCALAFVVFARQEAAA
ncbi:MAG TPA: ABC transporter permease subunit [Candidatus Thermoplasmatota archaeon]|nr:ABC transporter permease subunit [Candidatus Thermoplasmatota archaeon]